MNNFFRESNFVKSIKQLTLIIIVASLLASCVTTKNVTYFQGSDLLDTARYATLRTVEPLVPKIHPSDLLAITVSSLSEESNQVFNFPNNTPLITTNFPSGTMPRSQPLGYLVDASGFVELPLIGKVQVNELTLIEAGIKIKQELMKFLKEPTVGVRFLNEKFTILGEVNRPGIYNLLDNHTTLPEVLGIAGDLTIFGRRDNVMFIRTTNGKREVVKVNLNDRSVLESPYFYIRNNDLIYVEPTKGRITSSDRTLQLIPIVTGLTTSLVLMLNIILR